MAIDPGEPFMGVPGDAVVLMGRLAIASGRLEHLAWEIDIALGRDPRRKSFKDVVRDIRDTVEGDGVPEYAQAKPSEILRWGDRAVSAMDERDRWLHAYIVRVRIGDGAGWEPMSQHLKSGTAKSLGPLRKVVERIGTLVDGGWPQYFGLLREVADGIYLKQFRLRSDESLCVARPGDDAEFPRPTNAQLKAWRQEYGTTVLAK